MKAARWHGRRDVRVEDIDEPTIANSDDVIVRVDLAAICASDLAEWRDGPHVISTRHPHPLTGTTAPVTLGHEYVGHVVHVGDGVTSVTIGDRVCGDACLRCNSCYWCLRGQYNICPTGGSVGLHADGAFATMLRVPSYTLVRVPDSVSDVLAAVVEPVAVSLHALRRAQLQPGDAVVIQGFGMVGAGAAVLAKALGASRVIVIEQSAVRSRMAETLDVDAVLQPGTVDVVREVRRATQGRGADVVLECTGRAETLAQAVELSRRGGSVALCGIPHAESRIRTDRIVYFERQLFGSLGYRFDHATVLDLMQQRRLTALNELFETPISLNTIVTDGFERMLGGTESGLRIHVRPDCGG